MNRMKEAESKVFYEKEFLAIGVVNAEPLKVLGSCILKVAVINVDGPSSVLVQGRMRGITPWVTLATIAGAAADGTPVDVRFYDEVQFSVATYDAAGALIPKVIANGYYWEPVPA